MLADISVDEWKYISALIELLRPFYEITCELEGGKYPTISISYPLILKLMKLVKQFNDQGKHLHLFLSYNY
jgi:hypothetical protein